MIDVGVTTRGGPDRTGIGVRAGRIAVTGIAVTGIAVTGSGKAGGAGGAEGAGADALAVAGGTDVGRAPTRCGRCSVRWSIGSGGRGADRSTGGYITPPGTTGIPVVVAMTGAIGAVV